MVTAVLFNLAVQVEERPLSNCSGPTILFRGQSNAYPFAQDATAIYWTTFVTNNGFTVWKGAK